MNLSSILRKVSSTAARGFLLGLGFSLAVLVCVLFGLPAINARMDAEMKQLQMQSHAAVADIELSDLVEQKNPKSVYILGKATNRGTKPADRVEIQVNFFSAGKFVDQCSTSIDQSLGSGQSAYFKAVCCCNGQSPAEHDEFKVLVARTGWL